MKRISFLAIALSLISFCFYPAISHAGTLELLDIFSTDKSDYTALVGEASAPPGMQRYKLTFTGRLGKGVNPNSLKPSVEAYLIDLENGICHAATEVCDLGHSDVDIFKEKILLWKQIGKGFKLVNARCIFLGQVESPDKGPIFACEMVDTFPTDGRPLDRIQEDLIAEAADSDRFMFTLVNPSWRSPEIAFKTLLGARLGAELSDSMNKITPYTPQQAPQEPEEVGTPGIPETEIDYGDSADQVQPAEGPGGGMCALTTLGGSGFGSYMALLVFTLLPLIRRRR